MVKEVSPDFLTLFFEVYGFEKSYKKKIIMIMMYCQKKSPFQNILQSRRVFFDILMLTRKRTFKDLGIFRITIIFMIMMEHALLRMFGARSAESLRFHRSILHFRTHQPSRIV